MPDVLLEFGLYGALYKPLVGALWRASSYDPVTEKRPAGSGDTPWEALAWWWVSVEETRRGILTMARDGNETPKSALAKLLADKAESAVTGTAPGPQIRVGSAEPTSSARNSGDTGDRSGSAIDASIAPFPAPSGVDLYDHATFYKPSVAARRARTKRKK